MNTEIAGKEEYLTLTKLKKDYRLSPRWIERLGPPDKEKQNPYYRCAGPMNLWRKDRVEEFCRLHREECEKQRVTSEKRGAKSREVADRKFDETLEYARTVLIELGAFPGRSGKLTLWRSKELTRRSRTSL